MVNLKFASGALLAALLPQSSNAKCPVSSGTSEARSEGCPHSGAGSKTRSDNIATTHNWVRFKKPPRVRGSIQQRALAGGDDDIIEFVYSNQRVGDGGGNIPDNGGYDAVREDLKATLTNSQEFWPADFVAPDGPSYGGLFIRLAWHCNGSYRTSDGRGGCDGGSIIHDPVKSWPDNASLDMAIRLLQPIKDKYGEKLSWGDLIVLAGDVSVQTMGGPVLGFCGGRIDYENGDESIPLGPSDIQQTLMPCGDSCPIGEVCPGCEFPLGASHMGLIYVNPEGPEGHKGNVTAAAASMREVFGRMGFDDRLTVAATGGGHAFGKAHGACTSTEGAGFCPSGNTWEDKLTSGLEVVWTTAPTTWTNQYFNNLFDYNWTEVTGPGGAEQWKPTDEGAPPIGMLTTDLALSQGDPEYEKLSRAYAADLDLITKDFGEAWYQLAARDVGPRSRCVGGDELPAEMQPWETSFYFGPLSSTSDIDYIKVRSAVQESIDADQTSLSAFANLAMMCAGTFRHTDYAGGCNGAAIRFSPQIDWASSAGASDALAKLEPIKELFPDVSYADMIVLAGQTAVEAAGGKPMPFCGGRADAEDGTKSELLEPRLWNNDEYASFMYNTNNKGMTLMEGVALLATPKDGSKTLSNQFFIDLQDNDPDSIYLQDDLLSIVQEFVDDNDKFLTEYAKAFTYMVTADLFDGPSANACQGVDIPTLATETDATVKPTDPNTETGGDATETDESKATDPNTETGGDTTETDESKTADPNTETGGGATETDESKAIRHSGIDCVLAAAIASIFAIFFV